jgi:hypothetical protein
MESVPWHGSNGRATANLVQVGDTAEAPAGPARDIRLTSAKLDRYVGGLPVGSTSDDLRARSYCWATLKHHACGATDANDDPGETDRTIGKVSPVIGTVP